jgi:hypothetical protein
MGTVDNRCRFLWSRNLKRQHDYFWLDATKTPRNFGLTAAPKPRPENPLQQKLIPLKEQAGQLVCRRYGRRPIAFGELRWTEL